MSGMKQRSVKVAGGLVVAVIMAAGCGAGAATSDKAGGSGEPLVLTMATVNGDLEFTPQIKFLVDQVAELSDGDLRIEMAYEVGSFAPDAEQEVVRGVADAEFDLGFVGTQVFESLGFDNFRALIAPQLIDSYAVENAVMAGDLTDQMTEGIDEVGVTGLKVLGGAMRKPIAVREPLLGPADWEGITFGVFKSDTQANAVSALSATPEQVIGDARDEALANGSIDGFESSLLAYKLNGQQRQAPYVTANVNLWPQALSVVGNPDAIAGLSDQRREWLEQAADEAAARSTDLANTDADTVADVCKAGGRFAVATKADIAGLQDAFAAVHAELEQDAATKRFIEQIQALKESTPAEPALDIPADCTGKAPDQSAEGEGSASPAVNGTYRYEITRAEAEKADMFDPEDSYPAVITVVMKDGHLEGGCFGKDGGTFSVDGEQIDFHSIEYETDMTVTFSKDADGTLHMTPAPLTDPGDAFVCFSQPWTKIK